MLASLKHRFSTEHHLLSAFVWNSEQLDLSGIADLGLKPYLHWQ